MKSFNNFAYEYLYQLKKAINFCSIDLDRIKEAVDLISNCRGTVWLIGNGGSAALASHMATDLQLAGVRAVALTDVAAITTYSNDSCFLDSFSMQLERLAKKGDILIAISGSGKSGNIFLAAQHAMQDEVKVIAITGFDGGRMPKYADIHINIPVNHMGVAQDGHQVVLHIISYYLMERRKVQ